MHNEEQQIYWHSGLYLQPQHFQSQDLQQQWLSRQMFKQKLPWHYGVIELKLNHDALTGSILEIEKLTVVMPNGEYLSFPENMLISPRSFDNDWQQRGKPLLVCLGLRQFNPKHNNVDSQIESSNSRWLTLGNEDPMRDTYCGGPEAEITHIKFSPKLLWQHEQEQYLDYDIIPLLQLRYENGKTQVDERFSAPVLHLNANQHLYKQLQGMYYFLIEQSKEIDSFRKGTENHNMSKFAKSMRNLLILRSLNRCLSQLNQYLLVTQIHPWHYYMTLMELVGELSTLSETYDHRGAVIDQPALSYDHRQLIVTFSQVKELLQSLFNELMAEERTTHHVLCFQMDHDGIAYANLRDIEILPATKVFIILSSHSLTAESLHLSNIKFAGRNQLMDLIRYALPGIGLTLCERAPLGLPNEGHLFYFEVDTHDNAWQIAQQQQSCALFYINPPADLEVKLMVTIL